MQGIMADQDITFQLVGRAQRGDRSAFEELLTRSRERVRTIIEVRMGRSLRQKVDPEDLLQETTARALESIGKFQWQGKESFRRWLQGIAENVVRESAKKFRRELALDVAPELASDEASPSTLLRRSERFERLEQALEGLTEDQKRVILLARIEGVRVDEIARRMNRTTNAVRTLLFRAMQKLKDSFGDTESLHLPAKPLEEKGDRDE